MNFRPAHINDAPQLSALLAQLGYELDNEKLKSRILAYNEKNYQLILAEENNTILGFIASFFYEQFVIEKPCCHIDALIIHKDYRGKGLGKQLIAMTEQFAQENGANVIELITANHRKPTGTHDFYKSLGYQDQTVVDYTYFTKFL